MKLLYQTSVNPVRQKTQAIIKKAFEQTGIEVELKAVNPGVFFSSDPGNADAFGQISRRPADVYRQSGESRPTGAHDAICELGDGA